MSEDLDFPLKCAMVEGVILIKVGKHVLMFAAQNHEAFWDPETDAYGIKITDPDLFAEAVVDALNEEDEDGSTPLTRLLDKAIEHAVDQGCEGIEIQDRPAPDASAGQS